MCGRQGPCEGGGIPLYWSRERTIGRFHPIAQKQKTDLNIPLGIGQTGSRDAAKTKAAGNLVAGSIGARRGVRGQPQQAAALYSGPRRVTGASGTWPRSNPGLAELSQGWSQASLGPSAAPLPPLLLCTASQALELLHRANKYNVFSISPAPIQRTFAEFYFDLIHRTKKFNLSCCYWLKRRDSPDPK